MFSVRAVWALLVVNEERSLGQGKEEQEKGKMKEMWKLIPSTVKRSYALL